MQIYLSGGNAVDGINSQKGTNSGQISARLYLEKSDLWLDLSLDLGSKGELTGSIKIVPLSILI